LEIKTLKNSVAGQLPLNNSRKSSRGKTPSSPEFQRLIANFQRIAAISDPIERDFELGRSARDHGTPRGEFRRLFWQWFGQQDLGGAA
jgi:hypothetical protein